MSATVDERLDSIEARLAELETRLTPPAPLRIGLSVEEIRERLHAPVKRSPEATAKAERLVGILDDPTLPTDLSSRWHEYRYGLNGAAPRIGKGVRAATGRLRKALDSGGSRNDGGAEIPVPPPQRGDL